MHVNQLNDFRYIGYFKKNNLQIIMSKLAEDPKENIFWALALGSEVMFISYLEKKRPLSSRLEYVSKGNGKATYKRIHDKIMQLPNGSQIDIYVKDFSESELCIDHQKNALKKLPWDK